MGEGLRAGAGAMRGVQELEKEQCEKVKEQEPCETVQMQ